MRRWIALGLVMVLAAAIAAVLLADQAAKVYVNDKQVKMKVGPVVRDDRLYVPIIPVAKALKSVTEATWEKDKKRVKVCTDEYCTFFKIGDGKNDAVVVQNTPMAPHGIIAKKLRGTSEWDPDEKIVKFQIEDE